MGITIKDTECQIKCPVCGKYIILDDINLLDDIYHEKKNYVHKDHTVEIELENKYNKSQLKYLSYLNLKNTHMRSKNDIDYKYNKNLYVHRDKYEDSIIKSYFSENKKNIYILGSEKKNGKTWIAASVIDKLLNDKKNNEKNIPIFWIDLRLGLKNQIEYIFQTDFDIAYNKLIETSKYHKSNNLSPIFFVIDNLDYGLIDYTNTDPYTELNFVLDFISNIAKTEGSFILLNVRINEWINCNSAGSFYKENHELIIITDLFRFNKSHLQFLERLVNSSEIEAINRIAIRNTLYKNKTKLFESVCDLHDIFENYDKTILSVIKISTFLNRLDETEITKLAENYAIHNQILKYKRKIKTPQFAYIYKYLIYNTFTRYTFTVDFKLTQIEFRNNNFTRNDIQLLGKILLYFYKNRKNRDLSNTTVNVNDLLDKTDINKIELLKLIPKLLSNEFIISYKYENGKIINIKLTQNHHYTLYPMVINTLLNKEVNLPNSKLLTNQEKQIISKLINMFIKYNEKMEVYLDDKLREIILKYLR